MSSAASGSNMSRVGAAVVTPLQASSSAAADNGLPSWYSTLSTQFGTPTTSALHGASGGTLPEYDPPPYSSLHPSTLPDAHRCLDASEDRRPQVGSVSKAQSSKQATTELANPLSMIEPVGDADVSVNLLVDARGRPTDAMELADTDADADAVTDTDTEAEGESSGQITQFNAVVPNSVKKLVGSIGIAEASLSGCIFFADIVGKVMDLKFCDFYYTGLGSLIVYGISGLLSSLVGKDRRRYVFPLLMWIYVNLVITILLILLVGFAIKSDASKIENFVVLKLLPQGVKMLVAVVELALHIWQMKLLVKHYHPRNEC